MACFREIICLGEYCSCGDIITINLASTITGIITMHVKFNGIVITRPVEVSVSANIEVPNVFNDNYTHEIWFTTSTGEILNDTSYSIKIVYCEGAEPQPIESDYDHNDYVDTQYK